jgi:hypothetical protein
MNLTAEQFAELVEGLDRASTTTSTVAGTDRRRTTRVERRSAIVITLVDHAQTAARLAKSLSVTLRDFTPQGVGILLDRALEKGSQFIAKITRPGAAPAAVLYTVAYCTQLNAHLFKVGAEAQRVLSAQASDSVR